MTATLTVRSRDRAATEVSTAIEVILVVHAAGHGLLATRRRLRHNSAFVKHYADPSNRFTPFEPTQEHGVQTASVPRYPMLPMEIALKVAANNMTPWDL